MIRAPAAPVRPRWKLLCEGTDIVEAIGSYEADMRDYPYPFMRMAVEHDRHFGGGALKEMHAAE